MQMIRKYDPVVPLANFLLDGSGIDASVVKYITDELSMDSLSDFSHFWTEEEHADGLRDDVVACVPPFSDDISAGPSQMQVFRLLAAWRWSRSLEDSREPLTVGMGWSSPEVNFATFDEIWEALQCEAREPAKFRPVSDVRLAEHPGYLERSMTLLETREHLKERVFARERLGEVVYRAGSKRSKKGGDSETVIAVRRAPLRVEVFNRHTSDGLRYHSEASVAPVQRMVMRLVEYASKERRDGMSGAPVGIGAHTAEITDVSRDALWRALVTSIRETPRFFACTDVRVTEHAGFVRRTLTVNGVVQTENIYTDEASNEVVFRSLDEGGKEGNVEQVIALRACPLQLQFHQRHVETGFRVHWDLPGSEAQQVADAIVEEARRTDQPASLDHVGYGVTSKPISGCSREALFSAAGLIMEEDGALHEAVLRASRMGACRSSSSSLGRPRRQRPSPAGVVRVAMKDRALEVTSCAAPGVLEHVLVVREQPLRLELYARSAFSGLRVEWREPCELAGEVFSQVLERGKELDAKLADEIGLGVCSEPVVGLSPNALWRAMLHDIRRPCDYAGIRAEGITVQSMDGYLQRSMLIHYGPKSSMVTHNVRVVDAAQEISYRQVVDGKEGLRERVLALRTDPLHLEMFGRSSLDGKRVHWLDPRCCALEVFDAIVSLARHL